MNIFAAKLNFATREATLQSAFETYGTVESVKIITDKLTGKSKGFGFVEMPNDEEAKKAINELNDSELDGRRIVVKKAEPRESREGGERNSHNSYGNRERRDNRNSGGHNRRY